MSRLNSQPSNWLTIVQNWLTPSSSDRSKRSTLRIILPVGVLIMLTAIGVRLLHWHDQLPHIESGKMHFGMSDTYWADARDIVEGRIDQFVKGPNPPNDADIMTHPPGYSILLAIILKVFGDSITAWRFIQVLLDAFTVLGVFMLARELMPLGAAIIAGILVAISPQLAHTSIVLLPDSLAVLPIVWSMYLIVRTYKQPRLWTIVGAGILIGISCWFRPNAALLAPLLAPFIAYLVPHKKRLRFALAFISSMLIVIAPIMLRNILVFRVFTPLAIGVGHNLCAGIADYDESRRTGLLQKDHLVNQWEAQIYNRPEYARSLYGNDGITRDRERLKRGLAVIKQDSLWFGGIMVRRVMFMLTSEQTPVISKTPGVSHPVLTKTHLNPVWIGSSDAWQVTAARDIEFYKRGNSLLLDETDPHFFAGGIPLTPDMDYVVEMPVEISQGRIEVKLTTEDNEKLLASAAVPDAFQGLPANKTPTNVLQIPFVSLDRKQMRAWIRNAGNEPLAATVGPLSLYQLGESSYTWTRAPRFLLRTVQKFFTTWQILPLVGIGLALFLFAFNWRLAAFILAVPIYYLLAQAPIHTEHRYVIAIHYFLLMFAAFAIYSAGITLVRVFRVIRG